ncbi:hypothetical protein C0991_001450 [Blastosporella zonata]|nr:hypothetical protein C0991_001450 [Blastosporella zonata]
MLQAMGFDESYKVGYSQFRDLIQDVVGGEDGKILTEMDLLKAFQDAAQIQLAPDDYAPFLTNQDIPNSEDILEPQDFCATFVIPLGKEADNVQISALCRAFQANVDIAYVDGREDDSTTGKARFIPFRSVINEDADPITLLYRPGHYDILVVEK